MDDDADVRTGTALLLEKAGYIVDQVADGEAALQAIRQQRPDMVLLDRDLAGLDGLEVCRRIKQDPAYAEIAVIMVSAVYAESSHQAESLESGADGYIARPIENRELLARVQAYVRILSLTRALQSKVKELEVANAAASQSALAALNLLEDAVAARDQANAANQQLQQEIEVRKQAEARTEHLNRVLRAIRDVNQLITHEQDREALLRRACEILTSTRGYRSAWAALRGADGAAQTVAESGIGDDFAPVREALARGEWPACYRQAQERSDGIAPVYDTMQNCKTCCLAHTYRDTAALAGVLRHGERDYGALVVALPVGLADDPEEQSLFRELVGDVAYALHSMELAQARKRAEEALRESEARFRRIFEESPIAYQSLDPEGRLLDVNPTWLALLGYTREEVIGRRIEEFFTPASQAAFAEGFPGFRERGITHGSEFEVRRKDGEVLTVAFDGVFVRDAQGRPAYTHCVLHNITERKRAEAALRIAYTQQKIISDVLQVSLENTPLELKLGKVLDLLLTLPELSLERKGAIFLMEADTLEMKAQRNMSGNVLATCARVPLGKCLCGRAAASGQVEFSDGLDERHEIRYDGIQAHGHYCVPIRSGDKTIGVINLYLAHGRQRDERAELLLTVTADVLSQVIERKQAEAALRESEARFRRLFENSLVGIYRTTPDGRILLANPTLVKMLRYPSFEALAQVNLEEQGFHPHYPRRMFKEAIERDGVVRGLESAWTCADSTTIYVRESAQAVRSPDGRIEYYEGVVEDISEQRRLEEQVHHAMKMEAIGQLAGGVAHDFNNILAAIIMQTELTAMEQGLSKTVQDGLNQIRVSAERAANLTRQLLMFSRRQVMLPRDLDLNETVTNLAKMLQRIIGEDVRLELRLYPAPLRTRADPGMLDQVLMNLAVNARDAMPKGGRLVIETTMREFTDETAAAVPDAKPGRYVGLRVSDTGCGIAPEILPHIFEPFFTTKEPGKGTGLGLATVFGIVKQHGGCLHVESVPGRGATFEVYLPALPETAAAAAAGAEARPAPRGGTETILLVEDDPAVRWITRSTLERYGYRVLEAGDGAAALEVWAKHREAVALLVTDMVMPGGCSGQDLVQRLRADRAQLKAIYTTGYSAELAGRNLRRTANDVFLQKPYRAENLLEAVRKCLDAPPDTQQD